MKCPHCGHSATQVVDSQHTGSGVRHRRECGACHERFHTFEHLQGSAIAVVKRDGRREDFQREKLLSGLRVCARKRPLPASAIESIVDDIEQRLVASGRSEVPSRVLGEMVITHLRRLDPIAYIRFASAYQQFVSLDDMLSDLEQLSQQPLPPADQPRLFEDDFDRLLALDAGAGGDPPQEPTPIESARSRSHA